MTVYVFWAVLYIPNFFKKLYILIRYIPKHIYRALDYSILYCYSI